MKPSFRLKPFFSWRAWGFLLCLGLGLGGCKLLGLGKGKNQDGCPINNQNLGAEKVIANGFAVPPAEKKKREKKRRKDQ
ncbi:MAG: hypothetical protein EAZ62_02110 [Sphingobacteriia bacterium]|nr:MAG: hypothetical protein EAZ62_02110 [Sphingobacteriia bacterium]